MEFFETLADMGHEELVMASDPSCGYRGIIAVHSTRLGPALGGTRFWQYDSDEDAIIDALRLSRGMTYKNAVAGLDLGGGKSVIIGDNRTTDRENIFRAHGRAVESLGGRYITAEDVGTGTADMDFVNMETEHVAGLKHKSGDPSPVTAHGVFRAIQASAKNRWGSDDLQGKVVTILGV
ncbi:MAG TPA: Glu/Leu/Phe/Val dehydrogenase dimerization domain-containing protein, partial [Gemmatimonadaceae bacterium]|nr:Glu/Leu/Phe/Val dehydrogenase dimerization domain-containing protein [Gemmatimonadaceae bacterium]